MPSLAHFITFVWRRQSEVTLALVAGLTENVFVKRWFSSSPPFLVLASLLTVVLKVPSLFEPLWFTDTGVYLTVGLGLRQGLLPYRDIFDIKPPLIYLVAAVSSSQFWFYLSGLLVNLLTLYLFYRLATRLLERPFLVKAATLFFTLLFNLPYLEGRTTNAEHFFVPLGLLAFLVVWERKENNSARLLLAGTFLGLGFLFKFHAVFDFLTLIFFWLSLVGKFSLAQALSYLKRVGWLSLGFLFPFFLSVFYFFSQGILFAYLRDAFLANWSYTQGGSTVLTGLGRILGPGALPGRTALLVLCLTLIFVGRRKISAPLLFLVLWLVWALFGALLSGRPYPHYFLPVAAPLVVLLGYLLRPGWARVKLLVLTAILFFVVPFFFFDFYKFPVGDYYRTFVLWRTGQISWTQYAGSFGWQTPRNYQVAAVIREKTPPHERVFVLTDQPQLYALSERLPAVPYLYQLGEFNRQAEVIALLRQKPPRLIATTRRDVDFLPGLDELLAGHYRPVTTVADMEIYLRSEDNPAEKEKT